jgi:hypothetical protein
MKTKRALTLVGLIVLMLALGVGGTVIASQPGEPLPGTVQGIRGPNVFWNGTVIAGSTVTYTDAPKTSYGSDISLVWLYHSADIFVTADISPSSYITITPQFSADQSNWTDATYTYVADTLGSTTSVVTSTGLTTATTTTSMSSAVTEAIYRITMSADGTDYLRIPLAGKYLRFKIEHSSTVTPTINVMLRND